VGAGLVEAQAVEVQSRAVSPIRVFWATWTGWMLDAFDSAAYGLLLVSIWSDLLPRGGIEASKANIAIYGGIGFSVFVLGWAFSIFWGWLADRIGRVRTMCITILSYSVFTALCGVVSGIGPFLVLRFLVGFGVGGEWAAGTPLLHESVPESVRVRLAGWLHTAAPLGAMLASATALLVVPVFGWRGMFLLGVSPALLTIYLRWQIPEPYRRPRPAGFSPLRSLFTGAQAVVTWSAALMVTCGLVGIWSSSFWIPTVITTKFMADGYPLATAQQIASLSGLAGNLGALCGCLIMPWLANRISSRKAIAAAFFAAALIFNVVAYYVLLERLNNIVLFLMAVPLLSFFTIGPFALFTLWLPELFSAGTRGLGLGFTFSLGRIFAALGPLTIGTLAASIGSYPAAITLVSMIYVLGIAFVAICRETAGQRLPA
jgi:predicted MFS family arabinose efflux permease